jgi:hypothetical protein
MARAVVGLYERFEDAERAVVELQDSGFRRESISIMANDKSGALTRGMGDLRRDMNVERVVEHRDDDQAEDVGQGAGVGAVLGGAIGLLAGIGAFAIPGLGPVLVAGPLLSILTGAGIGAATGGLIGALTSAGLSDAEAREYSAGVERGGTLVVVNAPAGLEHRADEILSRHSPFSVRQPADVRDTSLPGTAVRTQPQVGDDAYSVEDARDVREAERVAKEEVTSYADVAAEPTWETGRLNPAVAETERQPRNSMGMGMNEDEFDRFESDFRRHYDLHYSHSDHKYEVYLPAYHYGYGLNINEQYRGRNWDEIEADVQRNWMQDHPENTWDDFKSAIREGWERIRGRH